MPKYGPAFGMATNSSSSSFDVIISSSSSSHQMETSLPSLREAFSEVRREESRKNLMMGSHQQPNMAESSALKTQFTLFDNRQKIKGGRPWCDHCRKPGHSRETCWKIHGKPTDWKPRQPLEKEGRGNHVAADEQLPQIEASPFNKEQMEMLQKLLSPLMSI